MKLRSTLEFTNPNQKGAALVSTLLIAALLLTAGGALILATSMGAVNTVDSAAEAQAYYGAEAGLQATLNVMRGRVAPLQGTQTISMANAYNTAISNLDSDTSPAPRLSRWLSYSNSYPDRVPVNFNYTPYNGIAYKIEVINPDPDGPTRLMIKSTGLGPRGATKILTMMLNPRLNEIRPPGLVTIRGNASKKSHFKFKNDTDIYSGTDLSNPGAAPIPIFSVLGNDVSKMEDAVEKKPPTFESEPIVSELNDDNMPSALETPEAMIAFLNKMEALAKAQGRYFTKDTYPGTPVGLTFLDAKGGKVQIDGGSGILIVTGDLKLKNAANFSGLIIVTGGTFERNDTGTITGAVVLADVNRKHPNKGFRKTHFHGGKDQRLQFDSVAISQAMSFGGYEVTGVSER